MADTKITALTAITTVDPANDVLPIVDVSDTSMAASGTTKKITTNQLLGASGTATLASATITGDLTVRTNKLKVDASGVGIGTTATTTGGGICCIQHASNNGLVIDSTAGNPTLYLRNIVDTTPAKIMFTDNTGLLIANVSSTLVTFSSSGNVGIGAAPELKLRVDGPDAAPATSGSSSTNGAFRIGAAGASTNLCVDAGVSTTGGVYGWFQARSRGNYALNYDIVFNPNGGNVGIGVTPSAGKGCLQLSSGINFPVTQVASSDANTLDDYKESTWTPTITAGTGTPTTVTVNSANYTKIGRIVVINIDFSVVAIGTAAGSLTFTLPFNHSGSSIPCGAFRENVSTGNMGQIYYGSGTTASCLMYNNATPWVNGYRIQGTYTYFSA